MKIGKTRYRLAYRLAWRRKTPNSNNNEGTCKMTNEDQIVVTGVLREVTLNRHEGNVVVEFIGPGDEDTRHTMQVSREAGKKLGAHLGEKFKITIALAETLAEKSG